MILPPSMTEGRVLSRRPDAEAYTVDSLEKNTYQRLLLRLLDAHGLKCYFSSQVKKYIYFFSVLETPAV